MRVDVIGIMGAAGCGKDTFAEEYEKVCIGYPFTCGFGVFLRNVVQELFGARYETRAEKDQLDMTWNERLRAPDGAPVLGGQPITGRRILQYVGTELVRNGLSPDFWCWKMQDQIDSMSQGTFGAADKRVLLIPDVRFENECDLIERNGGQLIHLINANLTQKKVEHVSERDISARAHVSKVCHSADEVKAFARFIATENGHAN